MNASHHSKSHYQSRQEFTYLLALGFVLLAFIWMCANPVAAEDEEAVIHGHVYEEGSNKTLANVTITITGGDRSYTLLTNGKGYYERSVNGSRNYTIKADKDGYTAEQKERSVEEGGEETVDFHLEKEDDDEKTWFNAMFELEPTTIVFALILMISLVIPEILKEASMIVVPFYIITGVILGLWFESHDALVFLGDIGILFLVFIAGMEIQEHGKISWKRPVGMSIISAGTCFLFGATLGYLWGFEATTSLLLGTILMSSSVGEIVPMVTSSTHLREKFADFLFPAIIIMDASSLFLLTVLIQWDSNPFDFAFFLVAACLFTILIVHLLPKLAHKFFTRKSSKPRETDVKFIITVLLVSVALGEIIGLHGILIAFLVGAILGRHIPNEKTRQKLHGFGHGFFIPIFFIVLGMNLDISFLYSGTAGVLLIAAIIGTLISSKIIGAMTYSRFENLSSREGLVLGVTIWPQLSATLAAAAVGYERDIFDAELLTAVVFMSITTALATPFVVQALLRSEEREHAIMDHILIVGYGRTSARLAYLLDMESHDFIVIDRKLSRVNFLKHQGITAVLGEGDDRAVLQKANVEQTRVAVITIPDDHEVYLCSKFIKEANPDCHIIARVHHWGTFEKMKAENLIDFAVWPEKLSSEIIIKHMIDSRLWYRKGTRDHSTERE